MLNDASAYFGGVYFGKHRTGFPISPNKTWEGYFSGLLFSVIGMLLANEAYNSFLNLQLFTMMEAVIGGVILSLIGSVGDLIESTVKRDGGVKDSGRMIPGHGGMWDTFDAVIFALPLFYYYLLLKGVQ
jgi:phosphatidate cytidylyltransferase